MANFSLHQFESAFPQSIENHYWHIARNYIIKKYISVHGKILDIGCGPGITVEYLLKKNFDVFGVELGNPTIKPELKNVIKTNLDFRSLSDDFAKEVKVVLLLDVIEHIPDPTNFLLSIFEKFPNIKELIITVPARLELWTNYDDFYGHYTRYTILSLTELVNKIGKNPEKVSYFFHLLYPAIFFSKFFVKKRVVKVSSIKSLISKVIHKLIGLFFIIDYWLIPSKVPGSSIIIKVKSTP